MLNRNTNTKRKIPATAGQQFLDKCAEHLVQPYDFPLEAAITEILDAAATGQDVYIRIGLTKSRMTIMLAVNGADGTEPIYADDYTHLCDQVAAVLSKPERP